MIYFDNAATTRCCAEAASCVMQALTEDYGNPSSMHHAGVRAETLVKEAAAAIAGTLKTQPRQILFTSGGTESDNLSIFGAAQSLCRQGRHIITTAIEHPAVAQPVARLKQQGFEVDILGCDREGRVDPEELREKLRPDTILVSVMAVNNEVGSLLPIEEMAGIIHSSGRALFHVDAIQAYGKIPLYPSRMGIDLMSVSSHKFHGPKGAGFLCIGDGVRIVPQILGGGQQQGMRSGTDNVPGISGMGKAAALACEHLEKNREYMQTLKKMLADGLSGMDGTVINGPSPSEGAPHILNVSFTGIRSEVLLHALEEEEIYVSAGSACSSHKRKPGGTLAAMNLPTDRRESALRFSFSRYNTPDEVGRTIEVLHRLVPVLRRFQRR